MTLTITADQQATLTAVFKDANGGSVTPDLSDPFAPQPLWTEDSKGTIIAILPSEDGLSCEVIGIGPGTASVICIDRGTGKSASEQVIVKERGIQQVVLSVSTPVKQAKITPEFNPHLGGAALGEQIHIKADTEEPVIEPPPIT